MREAFLKRLFSMVKCDACGHKYDVKNVEILGHEDTLWLFSASCSSCQTHGLVAIVVKESDAVPVITDLMDFEYKKFAQCIAVEINDVLDIHNFLKGFRGDMAGILTEG